MVRPQVEEGQEEDNHTKNPTHTNPACFYFLKRGHLQLCQAFQVGHWCGFDNWREFREQTFDKHDNALTALIALWLMTDIPVACLIQNANAALCEMSLMWLVTGCRKYNIKQQEDEAFSSWTKSSLRRTLQRRSERCHRLVKMTAIRSSSFVATHCYETVCSKQSRGNDLYLEVRNLLPQRRPLPHSTYQSFSCSVRFGTASGVY